MSHTTFRNMAQATATRIDIESGKRLIPDAKRPGQFKVLHKKPNVVMRIVQFRDIRHLNKEVRSESWALLRWANKNATELSLDINKAAVFFSHHDCSKLSATRDRQLATEYRQSLRVLKDAEQRRYGTTEALDELDALMDVPIV
jgi:hypothetical protein